MDDLRVITSTLTANPYVTRFRADLPAIMLDRDLELGASDRGPRSGLYQTPGRPTSRRAPCALVQAMEGSSPATCWWSLRRTAAWPRSMRAWRRTSGLRRTPSDPIAATAEGGASCSVGAPGARSTGWGALALGALAPWRCDGVVGRR